MGRVWQARDELLDRDVAVKEITPEGLSKTELGDLRLRAMREARAIAQINHPNVVRIFDVVEHDDAPWIIMELIPSRSLFEVLDEDGPMPPEQAAKLGLEVLAALRAAHNVGILHRDVKPANVLLAPDGRIVLSDFGLATLVGDATMTRPGIVIGSPSYLAPERAADEPADGKADLWSLGAVLFAAVEGRPPYVRSSPMATLAALMVEPPSAPQNAGVLQPVLEALLRKDPSERADVDEAERLLRVAAGSPAPGLAPATESGTTEPPSAKTVTPELPPTPPAPGPKPTPPPANTEPSTPLQSADDSQGSTTPLRAVAGPPTTAADPHAGGSAQPAKTVRTPDPHGRRLIWVAVTAAVLAGGVAATQPTFGAKEASDAVTAAPSSTTAKPTPPIVGPRSGSPSRAAVPSKSAKPTKTTTKPSTTKATVAVRPTTPTTPATTTASKQATPRVPKVTTVNNTALTYAGTWTRFAKRGMGDYQDDISCTGVDGASVSYAFTGTGVDYLSELNPDEGRVDVYLDGTLLRTVNLKAGPPRTVQAVVFSRTDLKMGKHTIRIVNKGTTLGMVDALRIYS